jgi:uncharacterized protein YndB with AHSA1/START domain
MEDKFTARASITINAPISKVWDALINPQMIKQYLFGTEVSSDFKEGSTITYKGEWNGQTYEDKGEIVKLIPEKLFQSTYWSSMSGKEDKPENYAVVTYELEDMGESTKVSLTQTNNADEEGVKHSEGNWNMVLGIMKKLLEQ